LQDLLKNPAQRVAGGFLKKQTEKVEKITARVKRRRKGSLTKNHVPAANGRAATCKKSGWGLKWRGNLGTLEMASTPLGKKKTSKREIKLEGGIRTLILGGKCARKIQLTSRRRSNFSWGSKIKEKSAFMRGAQNIGSTKMSKLRGESDLGERAGIRRCPESKKGVSRGQSAGKYRGETG